MDAQAGTGVWYVFHSCDSDTAKPKEVSHADV